MDLIIILVVAVAIATIPVMMSAKILGAPNSGFLTCLGALIISSICYALINFFMSSEILSGIVSLIVTGLVFSSMLKAGFIKSIGIAFLAMIIGVGVVFLFFSMGMAASS